MSSHYIVLSQISFVNRRAVCRDRDEGVSRRGTSHINGGKAD